MSLYGPNFYLTRDAATSHFANRLSSIVFDVFAPNSAVDLGCGVGTLLQSLKMKGCSQILGIEGPWLDPSLLVIKREEFQYADLTKELRIDRIFDVAFSFEVAEHLDEDHADTFVASLCRLSDKIVFSAAVPYQGGINHVNERWQSYWGEKFADRGYGAFDCIRPAIWSDALVPFWYRQNTVVYVRASSATQYSSLASFMVDDIASLDCVHPELYLRQQGQRDRESLSSMNYGEVLKQLPKMTSAAILRAIRRRLGD